MSDTPDLIPEPEKGCTLANGREVRAFRDWRGRLVYEVQPFNDNYWVVTDDLDRAIRVGNGCMTAADRRWLKTTYI